MTDKNFNTNNLAQHENTDFKRSVYFTDEVKIRIEKVSLISISSCFRLLLIMCLSFPQDDKFVNEFKILNNIGKGSFSKVKKVLRHYTNEQHQPAGGQQLNDGDGAASPGNGNLYAMKMMHKPVL